MSVSALQTDAFFQEAVRAGRVWGIRDEGGYPAPMNGEGVRAMPFWSLQSRAEKVIAKVPAYGSFEPVEIPIDEFRNWWLPRLSEDGLRVGLNWSGERATGHDLPPADVEARLAAQTERR